VKVATAPAGSVEVKDLELQRTVNVLLEEAELSTMSTFDPSRLLNATSSMLSLPKVASSVEDMSMPG
jgi:hypothetical protein